MGLDITAYRKLTRATPTLDEHGEPTAPNYWDTLVELYANRDFPGREAPLADGWYHFSDRLDFRAGAYSGYMRWREWLAQLVGYPATTSQHFGAQRQSYCAGAWNATAGPFWELINFSDCEGTIGSVVAQKLARDFAEWDERARAASNAIGDSFYYERFVLWRKAFEMAADGGGVHFH